MYGIITGSQNIVGGPVNVAQIARDLVIIANSEMAQNVEAARLYKVDAAGSAAAAENSAQRAEDFVGTAQNIPHSHVTGPVAVNAEYACASEQYDPDGKWWAYNNRPWLAGKGTFVGEGTTNLLPAGAENFVTGWANSTGETCAVTDYLDYIPGIGWVTVKRITGNGLGTSTNKYYCRISGRPNPHTDTCSVWCRKLAATRCYISSFGAVNAVEMGTEWALLSSTSPDAATASSELNFRTNTTTEILDILVYFPQIEAKSYATPYAPPGTTRAAATLSLPVGAYQKNLLTLNQATGGDTLGDTTGFIAVNGGTLTRDATAAWQGTGSIKYVSNNVVVAEGFRVSYTPQKVGAILCFSLRMKGDAGGETVKIYGSSGLGGSFASAATITLTNQFANYFITVTVVTAGSEANLYVATATQQAATFWVDGLQLEEGTTASDFALPAVDYSNAIIDPAQPFSIEFDAIPTVDEAIISYIFGFGDANNFLAIRSNVTTRNYAAIHRYNGGTTRTVTSGVPAVAGTKANHKISVSGSQYIYTLNGVDIGTGTFDGLPSMINWLIYFGALYDGSTRRNGYVGNVRIRKGVPLSAAERAYTGQLLPDQYTTYCSNMEESISSRPFVRVAGQAQNVVLAGDSQNQNALWQGDFRLASRGTSFSNPVTGSYLLDGLQLYHNGSGGSKTISQQSTVAGQQEAPGAENFLRIVQTAPSGQTTQYYMLKKESVMYLNGERARLILKLRSPEAVVLPAVYVFQSFGSGGSTAVNALTASSVRTTPQTKEISFEFTMPSVAGKTIGAGNHVGVQINHPINSAFTLDIADLDLKPANASTQYYRRDIQMLQQLGARTLQKLPANLQLRAVNVQANYIDFESVVLPVEMRATPALAATYAETTNWKVLNTAGAQTTGFTLALLNASSGQIAFRATKTAHGLTDATLQLVTNILLSAEL